MRGEEGRRRYPENQRHEDRRCQRRYKRPPPPHRCHDDRTPRSEPNPLEPLAKGPPPPRSLPPRTSSRKLRRPTSATLVGARRPLCWLLPASMRTRTWPVAPRRSAQRKTIAGFAIGSGVVGTITVWAAILGLQDPAPHPGGNTAVVGLAAGVCALGIAAYLAWGVWWLRRHGRGSTDAEGSAGAGSGGPETRKETVLGAG